ncbi:oxidoreductase [Actinoplanes sp. OR16]|uniref:FAD-binding oxidoreductase n=1 Tax=Actinoplanes sp. OR16 TaxID=946334 RepID=UPI000F715DA9|nr:FAD-binding oxidoreductase [Actinoplanes sp. OR16]BBH69077.1 oxidoreductase [Actinoplanes sp. OR16]
MSDITTLSCRVVLPADADYDQLRHVWNADIDRRPAAIARCATPEQVSEVLAWARAANVQVTVRGGGHNLAGTAVADGAVQIDTRPMNAVVVDQEAGTVTVGAGCVWGEVDRAVEDLGVAVPAGVVSHTGVAGLTLGGGFGYLTRMHGATVDHLVSAQIVVADGRILTVSDDENPDLFWAIKGAGHNYGVATSFTYRYVKLLGLATVRTHLYAAADRRVMMERFRDLAIDLPANVGTYLRVYRAPEYWSQLPAANRGEPILSLSTITYGDPTEEEKALFDGVEPIYTSERTIPHVTLQHSTDDEFRHGIRHYWRHTFVHELSTEAIDTILHWADAYPGRSLNSSAFISHQVMCPFEMIAGTNEVRDGSRDALPSHGPMRYSANIGADWEFPAEKAPLVDWVRGFSDAMRPFQGGTYINFTSVQGDDAVAKAVYGDKYDRLVAVKKEYDPANVFSRGLVDLSDTADS